MELHDSDPPSGIASSSPGKRKYAYGDSDDVEVESNRFDRGSYDESVFSMEANPPIFDNYSFSQKCNFLENEHENQNLMVGIDPSFIQENEEKGIIALEVPRYPSPPSSHQQLGNVDEMELDVPRNNHDNVEKK